MRDIWRPIVLIGLVMLVPIVPFVLFGDSLEAWVQRTIEEQVSGWLIILILSIDILLPIPSSVVCTMAGWKLGPLAGSVVSLVGMTAGAVLGFALARWWGAPLARRLSGEQDLQRARQINDRFGPGVILITRGVPVLAEASVLLVGIHQLSWRRFLLPLLVANALLSAGYSLIGYYARETRGLSLALAASIAIPVILALFVRQLYQRKVHRQGDSHDGLE